MWHSVRNLLRSAAVRTRPEIPRPRGLRLNLEQLEDRLVPSNFTAANVSQLIADINAANQAGSSNTITLLAGKTFTVRGRTKSRRPAAILPRTDHFLGKVTRAWNDFAGDYALRVNAGNGR